MIGAYAGQQTLAIRPLRPTCVLRNSCLQDHVPLPGRSLNRDAITLEIRNQTREEGERLRRTPPARPGPGPKNSFSGGGAAAGGRGHEASGVGFRVSRGGKKKKKD